MKRLILLCALLLCAHAHASDEIQLAWMGPAIVGGGGGAAGPNAWYYSCTVTPATEPTWDAGIHDTIYSTLASFIPITIPSGGTLTKLSVKSAETYTEHSKIALYSAADPTSKLSDSVTTGVFVNETWMDGTLGTPYSVSSGNYYVGIIADVNSIVKKIGSGTYYIKTGQTYVDFPGNSYSDLATISNSCVAVRVFVQ